MPRTSHILSDAVEDGVADYLQDREDEEAALAEEEAMWEGYSRHLLEDAHSWDPDGIEALAGPNLLDKLPEWEPYGDEYVLYDTFPEW